MQLPTAFVEQMKPLLGDEWDAFEMAMQSTEATRGLRLQRWGSVSGADAFAGPTMPDVIRAHLMAPVPWAQSGYYIDNQTPLGRTVFHEAGAYYLQEPSAMAVAEAVDPMPGERILDLCAAPGGKTTAIAALLQRRGRGGQRGQLVANEIHPTRVRALAENIERMGAAAAVVNNSPDTLAQAWPGQFDAILVDAPCSGEGMFRKDPQAGTQWHPDAPQDCAERQRSILTAAIQMLRPGGRLIYSTCTFNPLENEQMMAWLSATQGMTIEELPLWPGWRRGRPDWADGQATLSHTRRLWPHLARGEGHFVARLRKKDSSIATNGKHVSERSFEQPRGAHAKAWQAWLQDNLSYAADAFTQPILHKDILFSDEIGLLPTKGVRVLRPGTPLASIQRKQRFVPLHGLALRLPPDAFARLSAVDEQTAISYMRGETLQNPEGIKGYAVVHHKGIVLGFVKAVPGRLNNLYPKGWRKQNLIQLSE